MKNYFNIKLLSLLFAIVFMSSCEEAGVNDPGSEYMPDMTYSIAYEPNVYNYYYYNTWNDESVLPLKILSMPGQPVNGTIPRGYAGVAMTKSQKAKKELLKTLNGETSTNAISTPVNGFVPFYYPDTEEARIQASEEIIENPFPITARGLAQGKALYDIYCGICHGPKGEGLGYLVAEDNPYARYPAQPANLVNGDLLTASNGRYYFAIMYGKNVMGSYADKLSYEERWNVIHHIRALQAKATDKKYDEKENTFNDIEVPAAALANSEPIAEDAAGAHVEGTDEELVPHLETGTQDNDTPDHESDDHH